MKPYNLPVYIVIRRIQICYNRPLNAHDEYKNKTYVQLYHISVHYAQQLTKKSESLKRYNPVVYNPLPYTLG